jgi:hypothetical protein
LQFRHRTAGVAEGRDWIEDGVMKRVAASLWICFAAYCGRPDNIVPLAFGMTPDQAAVALGVPLIHHSVRRGAAIYVAHGSAGVPGFYPVDSALALQFRNGRLTGWKKDWQLRRPQPF